MPESYEFTKIRSLTEDASRHRASFETEKRKKCLIADEGPGKLDLALARKAFAAGDVVFVAFDSTTGACKFISNFDRDHVKDLHSVAAPEPGLKVTLMLRPAILWLPKSHPNYSELSKRLETGKAKNKIVWVGTFPGDTTIDDVLIPEQ